jgi:hypothetical protein
MDYQEGIMTLPIYNASLITKGQGLKWGNDAVGSLGGSRCLVNVDAEADDIFAIAQEGRTALVASNCQTPLMYQATVRILGNPSILRIYYEMGSAYDLDVASSTSTIITHSTIDDNLDGSWVYMNSGTGAGQLRYVKAADTTTLTVNTAFTTTPDSTTDFIIIRPQGLQAASTGIQLDSTFSKILTEANESATSSIIILKNFVQGPMGIKELDITANPDLETDGLNSRGVRFFSLCVITDGLYATGV